MSVFNFEHCVSKMMGTKWIELEEKQQRRVMFFRPLINEERLKELDLQSRKRETEVFKCTNICCKDKKEQSIPHFCAE